MTLIYLLFCIAPSLTSPLLPLSYSWEVLQDLFSDRLPILLTIPFSPVFCPNERPPSTFKKLVGMTLLFTSTLTVFLQRNTRLFTSLTLNLTKSSILFGRIKRHSKALWSAEVEDAVSERRKAFCCRSQKR